MCGNITIPYPFGVEDGCFFNEHTDNHTYFKIRCINNVPIHGKNFEVIQISLEANEIRMNAYTSATCYSGSKQDQSFISSLSLRKFRISGTKNALVVMGYNTYGWFSGIRKGKRYDTGCMTICNDYEDVVDGDCNGIGCCEASLPDGITGMNITIGSFQNLIPVNFNACSAAFAIAKDAFKFRKSDLNNTFEHYNNSKVPVVYNWGIGYKSCADARADDEFLCKNNTQCDDSGDQVGYRCNCKKGFSGNPYLPQGCTDMNECSNGGINACEKPEYCVNTVGGYQCRCPKGYHGNATKHNPCIPTTSSKRWLMPVLVTAGVGLVIITILVIGFIWHWKRGQRQLKEMQQRCFRQNGGEILNQLQNGSEVLGIFTLQQLANATNNFSVKNIVGRGGFGIVYKGFLSNNFVAIKKSIKVDPDQVKQFVTEILMLSKIKHKHVVKLLGCCLEDEVPLLVYEFINNATLYHHLHSDTRATTLTWSIRLQIASEVADALCHLHHGLDNQCIIHRDMKTMNILLDDTYTAKVADFGASRLVAFDQRRVSLKMIGTWGYLDPEYMQTCELTEKSDVYSFGVVLLELLTRKKVVSDDRPEKERFLSNHFFVKVNEGHLRHILDKNIEWNESTFKEAEQVANLAKSCLKYKGEDRPTMEDVSRELKGMTENITHPWKKDVDPQIREDCESLISSTERSDNVCCSSGNDSTIYHSSLKSSLEIEK
ncbi:putative wall-associated receptor kinase-like 16 isoform X2 [Amaranthus tricolor]|nr:putative wall-associated receptor kinase-like 16 isoform X2 [Amaranthus tricolor]